MEIQKIRTEIDVVVEKWVKMQRDINLIVDLSQKAISLISELIDNIKQDPSDKWHIKPKFTGIRIEEFNLNAAQEYAISLIPNALNEILKHHKLSYNNTRRERYRLPIKITSWEIYHSLNEILKNWCFIPKNV